MASSIDMLKDRSHPANHAGEATWTEEGSGVEMGISAGPTMGLWGNEPSTCAAAADDYATFMREQDKVMAFGPHVSDLHWVILADLGVQFLMVW